jgi:excisionase family DNA binding protein
VATRKSGSAVPKVKTKKVAGSAARKHGSSHEAVRGVAAKVPARPKRPRKQAQQWGHKPPAAGAKGADATLRGALVMPIASPLRERLRQLEMIIAGGGEITIVVDGKSSVKVGGETLAAMRQIIAALSSGAVSLLLGDTRDTELTSQEVADLLNVSRPYVVKLARDGKIPHKMVGNRHRFLLSDARSTSSVTAWNRR